MSARDKLDAWIAVQGSIVQGSGEWIDARRSTIGGSVIGAILGLNPHCDVYSVLREKGDIECVRENCTPMNWGLLFEEVVRRVAEIRYSTTIVGTHLYVERGVYGYSPDGLGVVGDEVVLFEFKSPMYRIPGRSGIDHYIAQVELGIEILEIPAYGILIEAVIRQCTIGSLYVGCVFDRRYTGAPRGIYDGCIRLCDGEHMCGAHCMEPVGVGFIGFYGDELPRDLTELPRGELEDLLRRAQTDEIKVHYSHVDYGAVDRDGMLRAMDIFCGEHGGGVLCYKYLWDHRSRVERNSARCELARGIAQSVVDGARMIRDSCQCASVCTGKVDIYHAEKIKVGGELEIRGIVNPRTRDQYLGRCAECPERRVDSQ